MRWKNLLLFVAAVLVINLPALGNGIQHLRLSSSGVEVSAQATKTRAVGGDYFVEFTVPAGTPESGDPKVTGTARVGASVYRTARSTGRVGVRLVPGSTSAYRVDGQLTSRAGIWLTLGADLVLLVLALLYLRLRHRLRPTLVLVAETDPADVDDEDLLDRLGGQRYRVVGVVGDVAEDAFVLAVHERRVRVVRDGHPAAVHPGDRVRVVGTMIG